MPQNTGKYNSIIQTYFTQRRYDLALQLINKQAPNNFTTSIQSKIYRIQSKPKEALLVLSNHAKISPSFSKPETFLQISKTLISNGKVKRAQKFLNKLPQTDEVLHYLAICQSKLDPKSKKIENLYGNVIKLNKRFSPSYLELAKFYASTGRINDSLSTLQRAYQNCPNNLEIGTHYGLLLCDTGNFALAEEILNPLVTEDPENLRATLAAAVCSQLNFQKERKIKEKVDNKVAKLTNLEILNSNFWQHYKKIYKYAAETPALWNNISLALMPKDHYAALFYLKRANYLNPLDLSILYNLGLIYYNLKQYVHAANIFQAARQIQQATKIPPKTILSVHCMLMLALSLWQIGDHKNSLRAFNESFKNCVLDPWVFTNFALFEHYNDKNDGPGVVQILNKWFDEKSGQFDDELLQKECLSKMVNSLK